MHSATRKALTLVELLLLIAIIGILVAVIVPVTLNVKGKSKRSACASNIKQILLAIQAYCSDNEQRFPRYSNHFPGEETGGFTTKGYPAPDKLHSALYPYAPSKKVWFCPTDPFAGQEVTMWGVYHLYSSYRFYFRQDEILRFDGIYLRVEGTSIRLAIPATKVQLVEDANPIYDAGLPDDIADRNPSQNRPGCNHFGGLNTGYLDGHVKWWNLRDYNEDMRRN